MDKKKLEFELIELAFCIVYCFVLYFCTYMIKYENMHISFTIFTDLIKNSKAIYIIISYCIMLANFMVIKSILRDNLKTNIVLTIITLLITIISYYKFSILEVPFTPNDILLIGNVAEIAKFGLTFPPITMVAVIVAIVLILVLHYLIRKPYYEKTKMTLKSEIYRIPLFIIGIIIIYFICIAPYRFENLKIDNELGNNYAYLGANGVFFIHIGDFYAVKPEGYSKEKISEIEKEIQNEEEIDNKDNSNIKANVIIIMNESFSDPNKFEGVEYSINPLKDIKELKEEDNRCIIGTTITPVYAGGTSLPEFEALTGMSSYFLQRQIFPFTSYIRGNMNSIIRAYRSDGYKTFGIHTYLRTFYNRNNVYKYLGFENTIFSSDIENPEIKGGYISDNELANQVIKVFNENPENKFVFAVTMQNHMPYIDRPYNPKDLEIEVKKEGLSEKEIEEIKTYVQGVYDGNKIYIKLVNYLKTIDEPTILLMFGDHLPALTESKIIENANLSKKDEYSTPYILWANYDINYEERITEYMSPSNLSLSIMEMANAKMPWYLKEFSKLYNEYPAFNNQIVIDKNNNILSLNDVTENDLIKNCRILQYELLMKKKYIEVN